MICAARRDTGPFDVAPPPTGRRERPCKWGDKLDIDSNGFDFKDVRVDGCLVAARPAGGPGPHRLFLSTIDAEELAALMHVPLKEKNAPSSWHARSGGRSKRATFSRRHGGIWDTTGSGPKRGSVSW